MFQFKMQSVLDYRLNLEEKRLNEFSETKRRLEEQKGILQALNIERENMINDLRKMRGSMMKANDITSVMGYIDIIRKKEQEQKNLLHAMKEELEQRRKDLMEAVKNRKVMERIREKHEQDYYKNISELEQKNSDEMSVLKYTRREI